MHRPRHSSDLDSGEKGRWPQTHKEQRSNPPARGWEALEIPFGEVWVFLFCCCCFLFVCLFNFLRTTRRRLQFQISSNGCNQSINKYVLSIYYVPRFLPRVWGWWGEDEGSISCHASPQVVCPTCLRQEEVPLWATVREAASSAPISCFCWEGSLSFEEGYSSWPLLLMSVPGYF